MSHVTKIILRILILRARRRITPVFEIEKFRLVKRAGTWKVIFYIENDNEVSCKDAKRLYVP